jgi:aminopeptidase-like protein
MKRLAGVDCFYAQHSLLKRQTHLGNCMVRSDSDIGIKIHRFAKILWDFNRSITGDGVRQTLNEIKNHLPNLKIHSVPSGTSVFDWTVPKEWSVKEAYIVSPGGERLCDFNVNNLHLVGYSKPFRGKMQLEELQNNLYSLPNQPNAIPYITSYYKERWGFCISHDQREKLPQGEYQVVVDSELFDGVLNYGELIIAGDSKEEVFLSSYVCHPSMANNELSGPTVLTFLAKWLTDLERRKYSYRIVFIPETIGSITYLSQHYGEMKENVVAGFNVSCVGDDRSYSFLPSRNGNTISDKVATHVLKWVAPNYTNYSWIDRGSDERQYCAPGIDLPIASIMRSKYGQYPEYHTSLDNLKDVVTPEGLEGGYLALKLALELIEKNEKLKVSVFCEPQLGKRGLYPTLSTKTSGAEVKVMMDLITYCDGNHSVLEIAEKINLPSWELYELIEKLKNYDLIATDD